MPRVAVYLKFLMKSALSPIIYVVGGLVGMLINVLQSGMPFYSWVPFVVPVFVQIFTRSWMSYAARNTERLLSISSEREEPSFLCDDAGRILVSSGRPSESLEKGRIDSLSRLFAGNAAADPEILAAAEETGVPLELHSPVLKGWYSVRCRRSDVGWMIWLVDVTERRRLDVRLKGIDTFRRHVVNDLDRIARDGDIDERTAQLILDDGWRGVFIAVERENGALEGRVYKRSPEGMDSSDVILVDPDSPAPVRHSRRNARVVIEQAPHNSDTNWRRAHPIHPQVETFLGSPYPSNFANWHEGDYTLIAFDKNGLQPAIDIQAIEGLVSTAHTVRSLIDMARAADAKFLQSVEGLSAAAEFSDEITGRHIHRVNVYAEILAKYMGLDEDRTRWLGQVAAIHDIGKVAIPHIIKLDRKLTPAERREMEMHTIFGYQILQQMMDRHPVKEPRLVLAATIAVNHHQHWDGTGYPRVVENGGHMSSLRSRDPADYDGLRGLRGSEIPIEALIVSLADKYDALRSARQYKKGFSHEKTLAILAEDDRTGKSGPDMFGPVVWEAFSDIRGRFDEIFQRMKDE